MKKEIMRAIMKKIIIKIKIEIIKIYIYTYNCKNEIILKYRKTFLFKCINNFNIYLIIYWIKF